MKQFREYNNIFFIGIGGIGMSALARFFHINGYRVAGYDLTPGPVTDALQKEGIDVEFEAEIDAVPELFKTKETLVVYTPAVPEQQKQLVWFRNSGFTVLKRSRVLGMITEDMNSVCVAGTHGKTTVSTMTAFLLNNSKVGANAFLGGISKNFQTNFVGDPQSNLVVLEADEFDRSFWQLSPDTALITSMDADHLDVYGSLDKVKEGFNGFAARIKKNGKLLLKAGLPKPPELAPGVRVFTYALTQKADYFVENLRKEAGCYSFDLVTPQGRINGLASGIFGLINVENAVAALALSLMNGAESRELQGSLPAFQGIARRFDVLVNSPGFVYIDDYAHHPEEIRATLKSVRNGFPGREITGVFQPHLYSRTRDFAEEFASALSEGLDKIILLPVYPAREKPVPGVESELIAGYIHSGKWLRMMKRDEVVDHLDEINPDVLITLGAGDIDRIVPGLCQWGKNRI